MRSDSIIDLRSDTVTRPDRGMFEAMTSAPLGDDVFGDDPTVIRLQETAAELLGKESALFVPSGTMGNSIALGLAASPGDEMIVESTAHSLNFEVGAAARFWGVQAYPVKSTAGVVPLETIRAAIRPEDIHLARSRVLVLEQTHNLSGGRVLPLEYLEDVRALCDSAGLHFHLDGARIFNASVASGLPVKKYAACADSVMFCISKGLGAPAGSLLAGTSDFIAEGLRVRKALGGGMRQAGILAACGLYALENNVTRLAQDHAKAAMLAEALQAANVAGVEVEPAETNMVYVRLRTPAPERLQKVVLTMKEDGVLAVNVLDALRFVFHLDVPDAAMDRVCETAVHAFRSASET